MKITDVVDRINGNVDRFTTELEYYIGGEHFESNELEVTQKGLLKENLGKLGFKFHFAFQDRDVVFMARNPHLRKAGMVRFAGLCSDASYILRSKDETVLSQEYLAVMLQSDHFWDYCESHKVGSVNFANNWSSIANYEFELPTPEEQKEISDKVWAAYRLKKSYKKLLAATEEMVKSQFIEMFGGGNWPQKTLGEVGSFTRGGGFQKSDFVEHGIPCIHYGQIHTKFGPFITSHITEISSDLESKTKFASKGDLVIAITSEDTEGSCKSTAWLGDYSVAVGGHAAIYKHSMNPLYMSFFFKSTLFNHAKIEYVHGTKVFEIKPDDIAKILVPCPPMNLQNQFSAIAEQADKSGFDGFKSQFIEMFGTLDEPKVEVKKLIDVVLSSGQYGSNTSATDYQEGKPRYIRITDINDDGSLNDDIKTAEVIEDKYKLIPGDIVFARTGATVGKTYMHETGNAIYAGYLIKYQMDESKMKPAFMKAFTHSKTYYNWVANSQKIGAQPNISAAQYDKMPVLVPQIEKQEEFLTIYQQADKSGSVLQYRIAC